jgi:hypothetical protein
MREDSKSARWPAAKPKHFRTVGCSSDLESLEFSIPEPAPANCDVSAWVGEGRIKYREDVVEGLENAPRIAGFDCRARNRCSISTEALLPPRTSDRVSGTNLSGRSQR